MLEQGEWRAAHPGRKRMPGEDGLNSAPDPLLQEMVTRWAAMRLGFDSRALRLERLMEAARGVLKRQGSLAALEAALQARDPDAEDPLIAAATVGETYFFRQHEHFDLLRTLPLPAEGPVLAWSAGCATGEETYSLAATLRQRLGLDVHRLRVWGTDVNEKALAAAREARYGRWSWRQDNDREAASQRPS